MPEPITVSRDVEDPDMAARVSLTYSLSPPGEKQSPFGWSKSSASNCNSPAGGDPVNALEIEFLVALDATDPVHVRILHV